MSLGGKSVDMTVGNPTKHILLFSIPIFIGNLFQQFYNIVDSVVVGKYVSADALAAIGTCGSLSFLFFSLSAGLSNGIGVLVSQYFGAKDEAGVKRTVASSAYVLSSASLVVMVLGLLLAKPILMLMNVPADILNDSVIYLRTTVCGMIFIAVYNGVAAILRALGDSKTPLYYLIMSCFLNIGIDLLLVLKFGMGVFGVGLATVIAQAISAVVSLTYAIIKVPYFKMTKAGLKPDKAIILHSFRLGIPISLQMSMISISLIILQSVANSFGTAVMSAYTIEGRVTNVVSQFYQAMNNSLVTYSGQNHGAGKNDRVKAGYRRGLILVTIYNLIVSPLMIFISPYVVKLFVSASETEVILYGTQALRITAVMYFALSFIYIPRGVLNGAGDAKFSLINGITEVLCRIVYANILTRIASLGFYGIWIASGLTWFTVAIVCNVRYLMGRWKTINVK